MRVRYRQGWAIGSLVVGGLFVFMAVVLLTSGRGFSIGMLLGPLGLILGIQQLTTPYFVYDPANPTITINTGIGWKRRFGAVDGGRLFIVGSGVQCAKPNGRTQRVPVARMLANPDDW